MYRFIVILLICFQTPFHVYSKGGEPEKKFLLKKISEKTANMESSKMLDNEIKRCNKVIELRKIKSSDYIKSLNNCENNYPGQEALLNISSVRNTISKIDSRFSLFVEFLSFEPDESKMLVSFCNALVCFPNLFEKELIEDILTKCKNKGSELYLLLEKYSNYMEKDIRGQNFKNFGTAINNIKGDIFICNFDTTLSKELESSGFSYWKNRGVVCLEGKNLDKSIIDLYGKKYANLLIDKNGNILGYNLNIGELVCILEEFYCDFYNYNGWKQSVTTNGAIEASEIVRSDYRQLGNYNYKLKKINNEIKEEIKGDRINKTHKLVKEYFSEKANVISEFRSKLNNVQSYPELFMVLKEGPLELDSEAKTKLEEMKENHVPNHFLLNIQNLISHNAKISEGKFKHFTCKDINGNTFNSKSLKGKNVLYISWADL